MCYLNYSCLWGYFMSFRFSRTLVAVFVLALSVVYSVVVVVASAQDDGFDDAVNGAPDFNSGVASIFSFDVVNQFIILKVSDVVVDEGAGLAHFTISRNRTNKPFTVDVRTSDGTATAIDDYTVFSQTLSFAADETSKTVSIPIIPDDIPELSETFYVGTDLLWGTWGKGTIVDDDNLGEFSINDVRVKEDAGTATFTVARRGKTDGSVSVDVATTDDTAQAGQDYTALNTTLHFAANEMIKTVTVTIHPDDVFEEDETFYVRLSNPLSGAVIDDKQGVGTIVNDDTQSEFSIDDVSVKEDAGTASFTITRSGKTDGSVSVDVATTDDTAQAGQDYTALNTTLRFAANEIRKTVGVTIHPDNVVEPDETFVVRLSNPSAGIIRDDWGVGTIVNDDTWSEFSIDDVSVKEDAGTVSFTITRGGNTDNSVSVDVATADDTAQAGQDYIGLTTTTLHFGANERRKTVAVTIYPDNVVEPDETFFVKLSNPSASIIRDAQGVGTIVNDDTQSEFSINDVSVKEDAGTATFTVTRGGRTDSSVSVDVATVDDTAKAGQDYVALTTTTLHFRANETRKRVVVTIHPNDVVEPDKTFFVRLSNPSAGIIWDDWGEGTILNDDEPGEFSINNVRVEEDAGTAIFIVARGGKTDSSVSVDVTTTDGTARAGEDYTALNMTLYFGANETRKTVAVTLNPDDVFEPDETFFVRLSNPSANIVWDVKGEGTIVNDDELPPREDNAPHAPQDIKVYRRQGQPLIQWDDDVNAQWYNFVIFSKIGNPTFYNLWYSKPGALNTTTDYALVECNGTTCSLDLPETKPLIGGGRYELWMRAWGTPDGTFAAGLMSRGGTASHKGMRYGAYNAVGFNLPTTQPQQPDPKGITVTNADTGQPTIAWQAADDVIWYQVWIGSQINGTYVAYHLQDWTYAGDLGCIDPKSQCTFALPSPLSNGTSRLPAGTYEVWLNSWGPSGFAVSSILDVPNQGWAKLIELTVGS